jgi:hypothetical protein
MTMVIAIANPKAAQMFFCVKIDVVMALIVGLLSYQTYMPKLTQIENIALEA